MNTKLFIEKANIKHNDFFSYDKTIFISSKRHAIITCPKHGDFLQSPNNHLSGYKCMECSTEQRSIKKSSRSTFNNSSKEKFGDKFDYSLVNYINNFTKIILICNLHGEIEVIPATHLNSKTGCNKCSNENSAASCRYEKEEIISLFNEIHRYKYNYSNVVYKNNKTNIEITCKEHGSFWHSPKRHMNGYGCHDCKNTMSIGERTILNFLKDNNIKYIKQFTFEDCKYKFKLRFDFYLPDYDILIEFDGIQHYYPSPIFGGQKAFESQIIRDNVKTNFCIQKKKKLFRIKYNENIKEKLSNILNGIQI